MLLGCKQSNGKQLTATDSVRPLHITCTCKENCRTSLSLPVPSTAEARCCQVANTLTAKAQDDKRNWFCHLEPLSLTNNATLGRTTRINSAMSICRSCTRRISSLSQSFSIVLQSKLHNGQGWEIHFN
jgi:hypothetical protein